MSKKSKPKLTEREELRLLRRWYDASVNATLFVEKVVYQEEFEAAGKACAAIEHRAVRRLAHFYAARRTMTRKQARQARGGGK